MLALSETFSDLILAFLSMLNMAKLLYTATQAVFILLLRIDHKM